MKISWLKKQREELGLTQQDVADAAGLTRGNYSMIECGMRGTALKVPIAKRIAETLGFEWTRFYEEDDGAASATAAEGPLQMK